MERTTTPSPAPNSTRVEVELSSHCIERFNERVKPCFDHQRAADELERLLSVHGEIALKVPDWLATPYRDRADAWALLGPGIALPLLDAGNRFVATTTMVSGGISGGERSRRTRRRKALRQRRGN